MSRGPVKDKDPDRPTVPEVAAVVREVYASTEFGGGCCLHGVVTDMNLNDKDCLFALSAAKQNDHATCERAALGLLLMTKSQRRRVIGRFIPRQFCATCGVGAFGGPEGPDKCPRCGK